MKLKIFFTLLTTCNAFTNVGFTDNIYQDPQIYQEITLKNPSQDDLFRVQAYLSYAERSNIKYLKDYEPNARNIKIIGPSPNEKPVYGEIAVNCEESDRENCLIVYASFNKNYPRGAMRLVNFVKNSDFKGHILYRLGGWPDIEGGSLRLAHVPYAFKVSFFREARSKGYKRALWLDTSILPVVSLNTIFDMIAADGFFSMGNSHNIGPYMSKPAIDAFGITLEEAHEIPSCSAGITGIDFTSSVGNKIVDQWYQAAQNKVAFFSPRSDQNALSIILYKLGLKSQPVTRLAHNRDQINKNTLLLIEREYVNELSLKE